MTFKKDLIAGQQIETLAKEACTNLNYKISDGDYEPGFHFPDFYCYLPSLDSTGEPTERRQGIDVKHDITSRFTKNVCFEIKAMTKALEDECTYLMYFIRATKSVYMFHLDTLIKELDFYHKDETPRHFLDKNKFRYMPHVGDSKDANPAYLVNVEFLDKYIVNHNQTFPELIKEATRLYEDFLCAR